jgi:EamA domain-containing membrane protein RarD
MSHGDSERHTATEHKETEIVMHKMLWEVFFECYHSQIWQQCKALGNLLKLNTVRISSGCYYEMEVVN